MQIQNIFDLLITAYLIYNMGKKKTLSFFIFVVGISSALLFVSTVLGLYGTHLNNHVFGRKQISTQDDKIWLAKTLGFYFSCYLFGLAIMVMLMRILTGRSSPASGTDPIYINLFNRILSNSIEQGIIFAGLYGTLLFNQSKQLQKLGGVRIMAIASLFVAGRAAFTIGYILGTVTGISTFRSFGFAIHTFLNFLLVGQHLGFDAFNLLDQNTTPLLKVAFQE